MSVKDDGGSAFASPAVPVDRKQDFALFYEGQSGMALRDYFAAHAPAGATQNESGAELMRMVFPVLKECPLAVDDPEGALRWWMDAEALRRYAYADAMIRMRGK